MEVRRVRVASYNVLSPQLCSASYFCYCPTADSTTPKKRLKRILSKLESETENRGILCLQEVSRSWLGDLHTFFNQRGYIYVHSEYGYAFNGYMGVGIAYPQNVFQLEDCTITRISESKSGGYKAPVTQTPPSSGFFLSPWISVLTSTLSSMVRRLVDSAEDKPFDLWRDIERRQNTMVALRLRHKGDDQSCPSFWVATYHMPCAFRTPPVIAVHCTLLLRKLHKIAKGDPYIVAGDFNIKPESSLYELVTNGKCESKAHREEAYPAKPAFEGDNWEIEFNHPVKSAYKEKLGKEPDFTNLAMTKQSEEVFVDTLDYIFYQERSSNNKVRLALDSVDELPHRTAFKDIKSFPTPEEPSDHIKIAAEFDLTTV